MIYDTHNPEVINFLFQEAKPGVRILDVGCGTGKLGKLIKSKINCYIEGIEIDPEAAKIAQKGYDKIIEINLEELIAQKKLLGAIGKYDIIILGDILEHIRQPDELLRSCQDVLKDNGYLIASIPNIANWMIRIKLLFGIFNYSGGILDEGHVRFFTYKTARRLLQKNGYSIISVTNNNHTIPIKVLGGIWKRLFAFQFVFKCRRNIYDE